MRSLLPALFRGLPDLTILGFVLLMQLVGVLLVLRTRAAQSSRWVRNGTVLAGGVSALLMIFAVLMIFSRVAAHVSLWWMSWGRGLIVLWAMLSVFWVLAWLVWKALAAMLKAEDTQHNPARRGFLQASGAALFAAPAAVVGYGVFVERRNFRLREQTIAVPGLDKDLDGLKLVQITDIHMSPFLTEREFSRAVEMANETRAHVALVTGDMVTMSRDPLDACLLQLSRLRADAGIFGCLGNHEIYAHAEDYSERQGARLGIRYLRHAAVRLKFGGAVLNLAGVDYQQFRKPYLRGAETLIEPGAFNVLLSHNPDVFPVAARQGYQLTISGHTHGGQVRVEILRQDLNIARFFTPYVDGLYTKDASSIFVSRGIGTIGMPARLGAPPEVALLRLCRT